MPAVTATGQPKTTQYPNHRSHLLQASCSDAHEFIPLAGTSPGGCWVCQHKFGRQMLDMELAGLAHSPTTWWNSAVMG